jgi:biopolymer transport protein TolQ
VLTAAFDSVLLLFQQTTGQESAITELVLRASPVAKGVLLLLLVLSVISWGIIFNKWLWFHRAERVTRDFLSRFRGRTKLSDVYLDSEAYKQSPLARVFLAGYDEVANQINDGAPGLRSVEAIARVLQSATIDEVTRMERSLSWLASTANASPFIGLFGTVVGIIIAFHGLTTATGSSIQAVAPGIAEALIATAAGIGAAVPAAVFYNYFLNRIKVFTAAIDRFSLELINLIERHYVRVEA